MLRAVVLRDLAINSDIPEDYLPTGGLVPGKKFDELTEDQLKEMSDESVDRYNRLSTFISNLPPGESTEWYFARFMENEQIRKDVENGGAGEGGPGTLDDHEGWGDMTDEEKLAKQNEVKAEFAISPNYASWTFNEETCVFDPPTPYPNDGKAYEWNETDQLWSLIDE